jgi:hypothetical protein
MNTLNKLGITELLFYCAQKMNLNPKWLIAKDTFVVTVDKKEYYINLARLNSEASGPVVDVAGKFLELILKIVPSDTLSLPPPIHQFAQ